MHEGRSCEEVFKEVMKGVLEIGVRGGPVRGGFERDLRSVPHEVCK